jgi:membrane dipeptidase
MSSPRRIEYTDHRQDPAAFAKTLGVSREAVELCLSSELVDLNVESFIWTRILGYDVRERHGSGIASGRYFSQVDLPRLMEAGVGSAIWSITTNPWRTRASRGRTFARNLEHLRAIFATVTDQVSIVRNAREHAQARAEGKHAAFIGVQGGNAFEAALAASATDEHALLDALDDTLIRVTLLHLTSSWLGDSSSSLRLGKARGLLARGQTLVRALDHKRIFVDLAHIDARGFWDAIEAHDPSLPLICTHTGAAAVTPSWRNLDDAQLKAIADSGGVIGVIFHGKYLGGGYFSGGTTAHVAEHIVHVMNTVGAQHTALGSDWDGAIITPRDMRTCLELPRLVQALLDRAVATHDIRHVLGGSFLRALAQLRP